MKSNLKTRSTLCLRGSFCLREDDTPRVPAAIPHAKRIAEFFGVCAQFPQSYGHHDSHNSQASGYAEPVSEDTQGCALSAPVANK